MALENLLSKLITLVGKHEAIKYLNQFRPPSYGDVLHDGLVGSGQIAGNALGSAVGAFGGHAMGGVPGAAAGGMPPSVSIHSNHPGARSTATSSVFDTGAAPIQFFAPAPRGLPGRIAELESVKPSDSTVPNGGMADLIQQYMRNNYPTSR